MPALLIITIVFVLFALLSRNMARTRQRNAFTWLMMGLFFGPIAPALLLALGPHE